MINKNYYTAKRTLLFASYMYRSMKLEETIKLHRHKLTDDNCNVALISEHIVDFTTEVFKYLRAANEYSFNLMLADSKASVIDMEHLKPNSKL